MRFIDAIGSGARVIEFEPRDGRLGGHLKAIGQCRYLGVVKDERRWSRVAKRSPKLKSNVLVSSESGRVRNNNGDALVLHGAAAFHLARYRNLRHASFVAVPVQPGPIMSLAVMLGLAQFLLGRLAWPEIVRAAQGETSSLTLILYRVRRPRPYAANRRFIPHWLGVAGFLDGLTRANVRHAVLRGFESLPTRAAGEDLDLLVGDAELADVRRVLDSGPGLQPIDIYSASGATGADYRGMPYLSPDLANELLDGAVLRRQICRVPSPREHFLSMAYHAVYHLGTASGLPRSKGRRLRPSRSKRGCAEILGQLAARLHIDVQLTLTDLDAYLDAQGWRPPRDVLSQLSRKNSWLRSLLKQMGDDTEVRQLPSTPEIAPAAVRRAA